MVDSQLNTNPKDNHHLDVKDTWLDQIPVRVEKRSERRALEKALEKSKASKTGYLAHAEDAL